MGYTVITGACGGLGRAFSFLLASRKENLLLLGRSEERLKALRDELNQKHGVQPLIYQLDLTDEAARSGFSKYLTSEKLTVSRLINVAGADIQKPFEAYTQEKLTFQLRANLEGAISLCHAAFCHRGEGLEIVNICSVSGLYPMPYFALYSASKRALWDFSVSLREEWKKYGVKVTAVLPGAIPTRDDVKEQIKGQGLWGKIAAKSPEFVAKKSLFAVKKNRRTYVVGFANRCMRFFTSFLPISWKLRFIARRWSKISKDAF